ncbi:MAG: hypothetical protein J6T34_01355 [Bacilli bacterium]|nr:hypothetical protein [Bacilli bacterium]
MFRNTKLSTPIELPITTLAGQCYQDMFYGCSSIKISATQTGEYQKPYRIPSTGTGTNATNALTNMFSETSGPFTGTPTINTTYYLPDIKYVSFTSPTSFTLATHDATKHWNGTIEYSIDNITWTTWTGTSISSGSRNN